MQIFADKIFDKPIEKIIAFDNKSFKEAFLQLEFLKKQPNLYLFGYIRYEAKRIFLGEKIKSELPLLYFEVYNSCQNFEITYFKRQPELLITSCIDYKKYKKAISRIKDEIACGNTYQVNYTYDWNIETNANGLELYNAILPNQKTPYNCYIKNQWEEILSFSPELFFELEGGKILTKPMKGTVKRGNSKEQDIKNINFLKNDEKNLAENVMIVDLLRNDLGKIAKTGTVKVEKLFEIETHKTLHQMTSEISARLNDNISLYEIFDAIFPCGSVTGAPKINTMKIIDEIETGARGVYCGAIGLITKEKSVFSVPIRILQRKVNDTGYTCRVGGAIVWDSTPEDEWEETLTKINFLNCGKKNTPIAPDIKLVETMLVKNGQIQFEQEHFKRMEQSAKALGFKKPNKINKIPKNGEYILRLLLSKNGFIEKEFLQLDKIKTNKITVSKNPVNSKEPLLYHKITYRPWYQGAMEKIKRQDIFDELFLNEKGELTEGARSNVILQIKGKFFTPPAQCGLLKGVLRQNILKQGFEFSGKKHHIIEKKLYLHNLEQAEKIFCINSIRGAVEVELAPCALRQMAEVLNK